MNEDINVVITTKCSTRHQVFLSRAFELFGPNISGIFFQAPEPAKSKSSKMALKETLREMVPNNIKSKLIKYISNSATEIHYEDELKQLFEYTSPDYWTYSNAPVFYTPKINSEDTLQKLRDCKPDLILVFGGTILKDDWISLPRLGTINLHTGILPFYRSCNSNNYALYHENYHLVGSTVHYVDKGVDTGSSISRHFVDPFHYQCFEKLRAKIFFDGFNGLLNAAVATIKTGKKLECTSEKAPDSYYPHAVYSSYVGNVAKHRLKVKSNVPWPVYPRIQERPETTSLQNSDGIVNGVYILLYHGIYNSANVANWEKSFNRIQTSATDFKDHMAFLSSFATPVKLSEVPTLLKKGPVDKPYFVVTFDDGYQSLKTEALPICEKYNVKPTIFACSDFASGQKVNFRILLSVLVDEGHSDKIRDALNSKLNTKISKDQSVLDFCKDFYQYESMNTTIHKLWQEIHGDLPDIHLSWDGLKSMQALGWEIGNHTTSHCILGKLDYGQHVAEIEENEKAFQNEGIEYIKWLSYPFGAPKHVNQETYRWISEHKEWNGIFAKGGVNTFYSRTEWLRVGVGPDDLTALKQKLF